MKKLRICFAYVTVLFVTGCSQERWEGYVYPDKNNLTRHTYVGEYNTLESCRAASVSMLQSLNAVRTGDYECGKNCKSESNLPGIRICEETLR